MSNVKTMLNKFNDILGETTKLMVVKGRLLNVTKEFKQDSDEDYYYTADIKVMQNNTEGYNVSFDMFRLVFPVVISMKLTDADLKEMKDNEVIALIIPSCRIRSVDSKPDENGEFRKVKYNNSSFYVADIMKTKDILKQEFVPSFSYNV